MNSSRQTGSIASFVVVGLVLAGLLVAGLYFSKERGRQVVTGDNTTTEQTEEAKPDETKNGTATKPDENTDTPAPASPAPTAQPSTPSENTQSAEQRTDEQTPITAPATGPTHIATTGPEDSLIIQAITLLAVSLATVSYVASRRTFVRSARS